MNKDNKNLNRVSVMNKDNKNLNRFWIRLGEIWRSAVTYEILSSSKILKFLAIALLFCTMIAGAMGAMTITDNGMFVGGNKLYTSSGIINICQGENLIDDIYKTSKCDVVCLSTDTITACTHKINNSVANGGIIYLAAGLYNINHPIMLPNGTTFICDYGNTFINFTASAGLKFQFMKNIIIKDCTIDANNFSAIFHANNHTSNILINHNILYHGKMTSQNIFIRGHDITVSNNYLMGAASSIIVGCEEQDFGECRNNNIYGNTIYNSSGDSIALEWSYDTNVYNNFIDRMNNSVGEGGPSSMPAGSGITLWGSMTNVKVYNNNIYNIPLNRTGIANYFTGNHRDYFYGVQIFNNYVENGSGPISVGIYYAGDAGLNHTRNTEIYNNFVKGFERGIFLYYTNDTIFMNNEVDNCMENQINFTGSQNIHHYYNKVDGVLIDDLNTTTNNDTNNKIFQGNIRIGDGNNAITTLDVQPYLTNFNSTRQDVRIGNYLSLGHTLVNALPYIGFNAYLTTSDSSSSTNKFQMFYSAGKGLVMADSGAGNGNLIMYGIDYNSNSSERTYPTDFRPLFFLRNDGNLSLGTITSTFKTYIRENRSGDGFTLKLDNFHSVINEDMTGILFSVGGSGANNSADTRGKGGIIYKYTNSWNRGDFMFLQNSEANATLVNKSNVVMSIKNNGLINIYNLSGSGNSTICADENGTLYRAAGTC
jgi:hypothetical protein